MSASQLHKYARMLSAMDRLSRISLEFEEAMEDVSVLAPSTLPSECVHTMGDAIRITREICLHMNGQILALFAQTDRALDALEKGR